MQDVQARDQAPAASEGGLNPIKAVMRAVGLGAGAPAGDDVVSVEGQQQLLQEREWDRHSSKQGRRELPAEVVEKHPSQATSDTSLPTPTTSDAAACTTCNISSSNTKASSTDFNTTSRESHMSSTESHLSSSHPLMGLSDECGLCAAASGALEHERQALLEKAAQLEQERAAHAAAASEAEAMRAHAAARAAELEVQLRSDVTTRRQQLLQQQEAAATELARLEASRARVVLRVHTLEGQLGRLVDEEATLLEQRTEAERLRLEIEAMRDGIIARTAELASLTSSLGQQQVAAAAAVCEAAAALSAREGEVAAAAERLALLQAQQQEARQALTAAEVTREQVSAELAAAEADLTSQQRRVDSLELKLPDLNSQHEQFMTRQAQLRQQAQALSADMSAVQAEAERVAREKEEKERLGVFSAERLASIDTRASQLSCQAAALQAKAAGAEGLLLAEQARAQAAEAEAHGLQTAAETLGIGKAAMMSSITTSSTSSATTTTTRHISSSTSSETAAAAGSAMHTSGGEGSVGRVKEAIHRKTSSGSSSSSSSGSSSDSGVDRREHGEVVPEGVLPVCKPEGGLASRGGVASSAAKGVGLEGSALRGAQLTPVAASEGLSESLQAPERDVLRDVKFEGPEVVRVRQGVLLEPEAAGEVAPAGGAGYEEGEGYAPLPRPSIVGPIGGALLPTEQGFAAPKAAELEIGHGSGREGATSSVTLGTLQGGLQPGNTGDVADSDGRSPRKLGKGHGMLSNLKTMLSPKK